MSSLAGRVALGTIAVGAACVAYGAGYEVRAFRLRRVEIPVLAPGSPALRVLHLSDLHLTPGQTKKQEWVRRLASLQPDVVVSTGDHLSHPDAVPPLLAALGPLLDVPGAFVFGSNDYYAPTLKNPARYLLGPSSTPAEKVPTLPFEELRSGLGAGGWADLNNARATVTTSDGRALAFVGVDDPHIDRDRYEQVAGPAPSDVDLAVGVVHAPYRRVLDAMTNDRLPLILAGHTHGGQLRIPGFGALVTNCDLPVSQARGLSRRGEATSDPWLHVSAGLGTSPFAQIRLACPPEATLLTLVARGS